QGVRRDVAGGDPHRGSPRAEESVDAGRSPHRPARLRPRSHARGPGAGRRAASHPPVGDGRRAGRYERGRCPPGDQRPRNPGRRRGARVERRVMKRAFLLALLLALPACSDRAGGNTPPKAPPPVPIAAGPVVQKIVPVQVIAVGNVQAYTSVSIKSRVAGQVVKVHFKEGDDVRRGDVLFTIDPPSRTRGPRSAPTRPRSTAPA